MAKRSLSAFGGFSPRTLGFLRENRNRNSKSWFEEHRGEYEEHVLGPLRELAAALSGTILDIDPRIDVTPSLNRVISKIYRDIRFSKDKSLFREEAWLSYKRRIGTTVSLPEFYFYMNQRTFEYGMGYYSASRATMDLVRAAIARRPADFRKRTALPRRGGKGPELVAERYKRPIANSAPADLQDWFRVKSFSYTVRKPVDDTLFSSPRLAVDIARVYGTLGPLYLFLMGATIG